MIVLEKNLSNYSLKMVILRNMNENKTFSMVAECTTFNHQERKRGLCRINAGHARLLPGKIKWGF